MLLASAPRPLHAADTLDLRFAGNLVLPDAVYRAILEIPDGADASAATAKVLQAQLQAFLKRSGYTLARVAVEPDGKGLLARIG